MPEQSSRCVNLIYGLIDPRTLLVRYVGKSSTGLKRPRAHRQTCELRGNTRKENWIKSLLTEGLEYTIVVLEATTREQLADTERFWIAYGRACGWPLTNLTDGGDGNLGWKPSADTLAKMKARCGHPISDDQRNALRERMRGNTHTLGYTPTEATREKLSIARRGKPKTEAHKKAISAGHRARRAKLAMR